MYVKFMSDMGEGIDRLIVSVFYSCGGEPTVRCCVVWTVLKPLNQTVSYWE